MDSRQAKEILACYRAGRDDPADRQLAEALRHARNDPELARWFEKQTHVDEALRAKLAGIPVPADLRARIIGRRPAVRRDARWRQPALRAAVALVVLAGVAGLVLGNRSRSFAAYREQMTRLVTGEYDMMLKSADLDQIRGYLASHGGVGDYVLTPAMQKLKAEGGSLIDWHGRTVSLICFEAGDDRDLFLFIIPSSALRDAPSTPSPRFATVGPMATATWKSGDLLYLFAGHGDERLLREYL